MRISHLNSQYSHSEKNEIIGSEIDPKCMQNSPMSETDARTQIANWLKEALDATSITQDDLAQEIKKRQINLDQSKISRIINKTRGMSAEEMLATADILKVPLPTIGTSQPMFLAADTSRADQKGFQPELSELALQITKDLEKNEHKGELNDEAYIQASALIYNMLRDTGSWYPNLFDESKKLMAQVRIDRNLSNLSFTDYVKSVAIYYQTLARAEKRST